MLTKLMKDVGSIDELFAVLKFQLWWKHKYIPPIEDDLSPNLKRCWELFFLTGRSAAPTFQTFDKDIRHILCIYYLLGRALDSIEDDPVMEKETKLKMLRNFTKYMYDPEWKYMESAVKEKIVLEQFPIITHEFLKLPKKCQDIFVESIDWIASGGIRGFENDCHYNTIEEWSKHLSDVTSPIGLAISKTHVALDKEDAGYADRMDGVLASCFVGKVNHLRDVADDIRCKTCFWPKEVYGKYCDNLEELLEPWNWHNGVACMHELFNNTLTNIPDYMGWLSRMRNTGCFRVCAASMIIGVATMEGIYNNATIFKRRISIRKAQSLKILMDSSDLESVKAIVTHYLQKIEAKVTKHAPFHEETRRLLREALAASKTSTKHTEMSGMAAFFLCLLTLLLIWMTL